MPSTSYFPTTEAERITWLTQFRSKLPVHGPTCGLNAEELAAAVQELDTAIWVLQSWYPAIAQFTKAATARKNLILSGAGSEPVAVPPAPDFPSLPAPVLPGIFTRIAQLVARLKTHPSYTEAVGLDLGVIAAGAGADDGVPELTAAVEQGDGGQRVRINFVKRGHDGVWIEGRRNGGDWEFLGVDTVKPYLDERPLAVANTPERREYRLRWWDKGEPHGEYCPAVTLVVGS